MKWQGLTSSSRPKCAVLQGHKGVSKALSPDMLGVLTADKPAGAVLTLMLKAEQAAIKTISPLECSWRDCLLLSEIPPGACSHFSVFYISLIFSWLSLSLPLHTRSSCAYLLGLMIYPLTFLFFYRPALFRKSHPSPRVRPFASIRPSCVCALSSLSVLDFFCF